jgi:hypothetical protein
MHQACSQIDTSEVTLAALEQQLPTLFQAAEWHDDEMMVLKDRLNKVKDVMDNMVLECGPLLTTCSAKAAHRQHATPASQGD